MAHTKHQAWREFKRAGQIDGMGLVLVVSDEPAANEITDAEFLAADLERDTDKGPKLAAIGDRMALEAQVQHLRDLGGL